MTVLRVVRGTPTDEELAAITAALEIVQARRQTALPPRSRWADRGAALRGPLSPGPDAWRATR